MDEDIIAAKDNLSETEKIFDKKLKMGDRWLERIENGPLVSDDPIFKFKKNGDHGINDKIGSVIEKKEASKKEKNEKHEKPSNNKKSEEKKPEEST